MPFRTVEISKPQSSGEGAIRRHECCQKGFTTTMGSSIKVIPDILKYAARKYGNHLSIGSRELIKEHVEEKMIKKYIDGEEQDVPKKWTYFELSSYKFKTYSEFLIEVNAIGAGLRHHGLRKGEKLELFASTSQFWQIIARDVYRKE